MFHVIIINIYINMWFQYKNHNSSYNFFFIKCLCQNTLQFWPSCQRILLLLSKSVKATILLQNRTLSLSVLVKGLFCLPLLKDSFFYCSYQRALYFIALAKRPSLLLLPSPVELITFSMTGWAADLLGCLGFSLSTSSTSLSTSNLH